jgi:peroxin-6
MYIGESEANVRRVFQRARDARPCVVFFDELDSVAPRRGNQADSAGVMDRIVSQLLAELDGMSDSSGDSGVFVIGATNRPDLLDPALLRPGRFDKMLYLGVSQTHDQQVHIIRALTRKFNLSPDVDLLSVAETCPFTFTGADFYALCSDAQLKAMTRAAEKVNVKVASYPRKVTTQWWFDHVATEEDLSWQVEMQDFIAAREGLVPSVSAEEQETYRRLQSQFSDVKGGEVRVNGAGKGKGKEVGSRVFERSDGWVARKSMQVEFDETDGEYNSLYKDD